MASELAYIGPKRTEKVRAALAEALDTFSAKVRADAMKGNMQAIKAMSMLAGISPMAKMFINRLSDEDADSFVAMLERFLERVNG